MKTEKELAIELGVDRKVLIKWRKEGIVSTSCWIKAGNTISYHAEGEHELRNVVQRALMVEELSDPLPVAKEPEEMEITGIPRNPRLILCGDRKVRVSLNKNFLIGMKVRARPSIDSESIWVMVGRCPRWRGRY